MAVEARHLSLFPGQVVQDRQSLNPYYQANLNLAYNTQMGFSGAPLGASLPEYQSLHRPAVCNSVQAKTSGNTDSGLTYNASASRKRQRDSANHLYGVTNFPALAKQGGVSQHFQSSFDAGEDILPQIQQYQLEIDAIISQHNKKIRLELEEKQKQQTRLIAAAVGETVMKKLREKDEQIQRMRKLNLVLQERAKTLYVENQLWWDLAQTNEAEANSLRSNLEQVMLHVSGGRDDTGAAVEEDVESCCGSSDNDGRDEHGGGSGERMCKMCREREPCVLVLPCRHLCLCGACGSGSRQVQECPVCKSIMDATLHVNMASS